MNFVFELCGDRSLGPSSVLLVLGFGIVKESGLFKLLGSDAVHSVTFEISNRR